MPIGATLSYELNQSHLLLISLSSPDLRNAVDDISFLNPVDVGELLIFNSRVLYTLPEGGAPLKLDGDNPLVMVEVEAWVTKPEKVSSNMSNKFHFTFSLPGKVTCKKVVPSSLEEGKRMAARMAADVEQAKFGA